MIVLIVIGSILLLIIILLALSVTIELDYDKTFCYKVKYLFFTIAVDPESEKRKKKRKKKAAKRKRKEEKKKQKQLKKQNKKAKKTKGNAVAVQSDEKNPSTSSGEKTENKPQEAASAEKKKAKLDIKLIKRIFGRASPHIKRILKHIRIFDVYIDIVVGGDDAAKVAINYGKMNALVNGGLEVLDAMITLKVEEVVIEADFDKEKSDYFAHAKAKLRLSTLLHSGIWGFFAILSETRAETTPTQAQKPQKSQKSNSTTKGK